ncbi:MAG: MFS transporter, partial [Nitrospira sp.]
VIGILETLPPLILGPFIGVYLDRVSKRSAMIVIDVARACLLILIPTLYALGWLTLGWLYVLVFVIALFSSAYGPALSAALPLLVDKQQLTRVNALMQSSMMFGQLLGPAASGILIATIDAQNVLYVTAGAFVLSTLCKIPVTIPHQPVPLSSDGVLSQAGRALMEGLRFIFVHDRLLVLLMIVASIFTLGSTGFIYLLPILGQQLLHVDSVALGWLWSSLSIGILITTLWLLWKKQEGLCIRLWTLVAAALAGGVAVLLLPSSSSLVISAGLIILIGAGSGLVTPIISASLQERTPKNLMARVFGAFNSGVMACAMLGMTLFGWIADTFGASASLFGIGAVHLGAATITAALIPWCRRLARTPATRQGVSR